MRKGETLWPTARDMLLARIDIVEECWIWNGPKTVGGYGRIEKTVFGTQHKVTKAHQLSYIIFNGDYDRSLYICHRCNIKDCINPKHIYAGTAADNARDLSLAGNRPNNKGENHSQNRLKNVDIVLIRHLLLTLKGNYIAKIFNMTTSTISAIKVGKRWSRIK